MELPAAGRGRFQTCSSHKIDTGLKRFFQFVVQPAEDKAMNGGDAEVYQQIHVAFCRSVPSGVRAEEIDGCEVVF